MAIEGLIKSTRHRNSISLVTPAEQRAVKVADFKTFARHNSSSASADDADKTLEGFLDVAISKIETALNLSMIQQVWKLELDAWPTEALYGAPPGAITVALPRYPLVSVNDPITIYAADGSVQTTLTEASSDYEYNLNSVPGLLVIKTATTPGKILRGISIEFTAGYGTTADSVPVPLQMAVMMWASRMYSARKPHAALGKKTKMASPFAMPQDVSDLIAEYKMELV
jgi:uncharacterized phiE125 gp8 family phage protein